MGQFTTPQKRPTMQRPAPKEGLRPTSGPSRHPMVEPTKKEGTISPPFMPQPMVMAVSRSLSDHVRPGAVVPARVEKERYAHHQRSAHGHPQIPVGEELPEQLVGGVHDLTEEDADQGAYEPQHQRRPQALKAQGRDPLQDVRLRLRAQEPGDVGSGEDQRGKVRRDALMLLGGPEHRVGARILLHL